MMPIPAEAEDPLGERRAATVIEGIRFELLGTPPAVSDCLSASQENIDRLDAGLSHRR